eukprot:403375828
MDNKVQKSFEKQQHLKKQLPSKLEQQTTTQLKTYAFDIWLIVTCLKLLLFHSYKSTDFEVHRNWMAITYEKPLSEWYFEATSEWTLDYPPFFAYFEWILAQVAVIFDPEMVKVKNLYYDSLATIYYQRATVIVSDLIFFYACYRYFKSKSTNGQIKFDTKYFAFNYLNAGLIILDNIHFQYNSMIFGPFIYTGQLKQIVLRLFPFSRGLVHFYWASNMWAGFMFYNKYMVNILKMIQTGTKIPIEYVVEDIEMFKKISLGLTLVFLVPLIIAMLMKLNRKNFNFYLAMTNFIVYNFGFHVHEKAILMTIIPLM